MLSDSSCEDFQENWHFDDFDLCRLFSSRIQDQIGPVQRTKWSLCSDHHGSTPTQSPIWQRRLRYLPRTFPCSGPFQNLLRCANTWKPTLDDCAKSKKIYSIETLVPPDLAVSHPVRIVLYCVCAVYLQCTIKDDSKPRNENRSHSMSACPTAVALFSAALLIEAYGFSFTLYVMLHAANSVWESGCTSPRRTSPGW